MKIIKNISRYILRFSFLFRNWPSLGNIKSEDPGFRNGFGGKSLIRQKFLQIHNGQKLEAEPVLKDVQIITRYCATEAPYWHSFVGHYHRLGVSVLHVCVQSKADECQLHAFPYPAGIQLFVYRLQGNIDPSSAIRKFDVSRISHKANFTLMVDCDEFLAPLRHDLSVRRLFETFPDINQFFCPWIMCPVLDQNKFERLGFWGHIGKPIARSEYIQKIKNDHEFTLKTIDQSINSSAPAGLFGFCIVHFWSRSFRDCLLKTVNNRFVDAKSADQSIAFDLINKGILPVRLKLLAYLSAQHRSLLLPGSLKVTVDEELEEELLRQTWSHENEAKCRDLFFTYLNHSKNNLLSMPLYPANSLTSIAKYMPDHFQN